MTEIKEKRQTGYIYSIRSYQTDEIYIGSTYGTLRQRLYQHKHNYMGYLNETTNYVSSFEIVKFDDVYIELVETHENVNKMELQRHEGECIRRTEKCVNKQIAGRTKKEYNEEYYNENKDKIKEYYNENIEKIKEYHKEYYNDNKEYHKEYRTENIEKIKEYQKEYQNEYQKEKYICSCGKSLSTSSKARHNKICKNKILIIE